MKEQTTKQKYQFEKIDFVNKTLATYIGYFYTKDINENGNILANVNQINRIIGKSGGIHDLSYLTINFCEILGWMKDIAGFLTRSTKDTKEIRNGKSYDLLFINPLQFHDVNISKINLFLTDKSKNWFFENYRSQNEIDSINSLFHRLNTETLTKEQIVQVLNNLINRFSKLIQAGKCESREREEYYKFNDIQKYFELKLERIYELKDKK